VTCAPGSDFATSTLTILTASVEVSCQDKWAISLGSSFDRRIEILNSNAAAAEDVTVHAAGLSLSVPLVYSTSVLLIVNVSDKAGHPGLVPFVFFISQQQISILFLVIDDTLSIFCVICDVPSLCYFNTVAGHSDIVLLGGNLLLAPQEFPAGTINDAQDFTAALQSAFSVISGVFESIDYDQGVNASKCCAKFSDTVALTLDAKLGCTWLSKRSALLSLGSGATTKVIARAPYAIDFKFRTTPSASVKVRAPLSPLPLKLTFKGPSNAGARNSVQLRSSVTATRPIPVSLACSNDADFNSYLQLQSNFTPMTEPSFFLTHDKVYQLPVRVQNFFSASAESAIFLLRADADATSKLLVFLISNTVCTSTDDFNIKINSVFSLCPGRTPEPVVYSWSMDYGVNISNEENTHSAMTSAILAHSSFSKPMIPTKTLAFASKYKLRMSSLVITQRSSSSVPFKLGTRVFICAFAGASSATSATVPINISSYASMRFDLDFSSTVFSYSWKFTDASGSPCMNMVGVSLAIASGKSSSTDASVLYSTVVEARFRFMFVTNSSNSHCSFSSFSLQNVAIITVDVLTTHTVINVDEQLSLRGAIQGASDATVTVTWTEPMITNVAAVADPSLKDTSKNLVVLPGTLEPGKTYTFTMKASKGSGISSQTSHASQTLTLNMPPTAGSCSIAQSIECSLCNEDQLCMNYRFGYQVVAGKTMFDHTFDSVKDSFKVLSLPKGDVTVTVLVVVCIALGACVPAVFIPATVNANGDMSPSRIYSKLDISSLTVNIDKMLQFSSAASKKISPAGSWRAPLQAQSMMNRAFTDLQRPMISTLSVGGASDVVSTLAFLSSNSTGLQKTLAEKHFGNLQCLLMLVIVNAARTPSSSVPENSFSTISFIVAFSQAGAYHKLKAEVARNVDAVKVSSSKFGLDGTVAGSVPTVLSSSFAGKIFLGVKMPAAGSTDRLSLAPDVVTFVVAFKFVAVSSRSSVRILIQTTCSGSVFTTSGFSLHVLRNAEGQLAACMMVQSNRWKLSDALEVVAGTLHIGLTLFRSGSDRAMISFASSFCATNPATVEPKGQVAKIAFWDAASGKYGDTGHTKVISAGMSSVHGLSIACGAPSSTAVVPISSEAIVKASAAAFTLQKPAALSITSSGYFFFLLSGIGCLGLSVAGFCSKFILPSASVKLSATTTVMVCFPLFFLSKFYWGCCNRRHTLNTVA
jgi:hypothetical protein